MLNPLNLGYPSLLEFIFSKFASLDTVLREKDRVEIYRPLVADPKEVRKERAAKVKAMRGTKKA